MHIVTNNALTEVLLAQARLTVSHLGACSVELSWLTSFRLQKSLRVEERNVLVLEHLPDVALRRHIHDFGSEVGGLRGWAS